MRKVWLGFVLALLATPAFAQLPPVIEGFQNPVMLGGVQYRQETKKVAILLTANLPGFKLQGLPLYVGGVGVDLRSIDQALGETANAGISVPLLTWAIGGGQGIFQFGWAHDMHNNVSSSGLYAGLGFSLTSPNKLAYKRAVKKAKKLGMPPPACPY